MNNHQILRLVAAAVCVGAVASHSRADDLEGVLGGMRYDNWWVAARLPEPVGNHPLYPPAGQQSGPTTWRCVECHGWDYKGIDGEYGAGEHFTGIRGVFGSTLTREEMFDLLRSNHGYQNSGISDQDIEYLVEFLQSYVIETDSYVDASGAFIGNSDEGRYNYRAANGYFTCLHCHGDQPAAIRQVAMDEPGRFMHIVRFGLPSGAKPSWVLGDGADQAVADMGRYLQDGFPGPHYAGEQACAGCHADYPTPGFFEGYRRTGHPWKIFRTAGQEPVPDTWPFTDVPPLPIVRGAPLQWSDVEYVIGNYFWKTRFIDRQGYIYTGNAGEVTQWNIATQRWVAYEPGTVKPFNCGSCHTTGYNPQGNQHGLPGLIGTWAEDGVRCEECHGPSSDHVSHATEMLPPGGRDCVDCHHRDHEFRMPWAGGFMRHQESGEELRHSPHDGRLSCISCHEPHRSSVYGESAIRRQCTDCHEGDASNNFYVVTGMESVACVDCHMPYMMKSAESFNAHTADIRGHLFRITRAPILASQNVYQIGSNFYWNQNQFGESFATLDYACMGCHTQIGRPLTIEQASAFATGIHTRPPCAADFNDDGALNSQDFFDFLACFLAPGQCPAPGADFNGDGTEDSQDFFDFLAAFFAGCP
jgi:predicted CXXCH cytochrome family protein